jgi:hypothetical protein
MRRTVDGPTFRHARLCFERAVLSMPRPRFHGALNGILVCYHFATQLLGTGHYSAVRQQQGDAEKLCISGLIGTTQYGLGVQRITKPLLYR